MVVTRGKGEAVKGKGGQIHGTEGDVTLGAGHTMQYTDEILQDCTLETYIILLTNNFF